MRDNSDKLMFLFLNVSKKSKIVCVIRYIENNNINNNNMLLSFIEIKMIINKITAINKAILNIPITSGDIHLCFGPDVIKNNSGSKNGAKIKL